MARKAILTEEQRLENIRLTRKKFNEKLKKEMLTNPNIILEIKEKRKRYNDLRKEKMNNDPEYKKILIEKQKKYGEKYRLKKGYVPKVKKQKDTEIKPRVKKQKNIENIIKTKKTKNKNYLNNTDLIQQIIISKNKNKITDELGKMIMLISTNLSRRFTYVNPDDRNDCIGSGVLQMSLNYHNFNEHKYDNALAYMTEICKRAMAKQFNELHYKNQDYSINCINFSTIQTQFIRS
jgi:hypothetical protein